MRGAPGAAGPRAPPVRARLISTHAARARPSPPRPRAATPSRSSPPTREGNAVSLIQSLYFTWGSGRPGRRHGGGAPESRVLLLARCRPRERARPGQADDAHADPVHVPRGRAAALRLRHDGRRGPAADPGRAPHPRLFRGLGPQAARRGAPLALRPHVGRRRARPQPRGTLPGRSSRATSTAAATRSKMGEEWDDLFGHAHCIWVDAGGRGLVGGSDPAGGRRRAGVLDVAAGEGLVQLEAHLREVGAGLDRQARVGPGARARPSGSSRP